MAIVISFDRQIACSLIIRMQTRHRKSRCSTGSGSAQSLAGIWPKMPRASSFEFIKSKRSQA
jgi:hypothetical protein